MYSTYRTQPVSLPVLISAPHLAKTKIYLQTAVTARTVQQYLDAVAREVAGVHPDELCPGSPTVVRRNKIRLRTVHETSGEPPQVFVNLKTTRFWNNNHRGVDFPFALHPDLCLLETKGALRPFWSPFFYGQRLAVSCDVTPQNKATISMFPIFFRRALCA